MLTFGGEGHTVWNIRVEHNIPESVDDGFGMLHWYSLNTSLVHVQSSYNGSSKLAPHVKQLNGLRPLHLLPAVLLLLLAVQTENNHNSYKKSNFHEQILRQPHFCGFNSHCVISYQATSPFSQSGKIWIIAQITQSVMWKCKTKPEVLRHMAGLLEYPCMNTRKLHSKNKCI